MANKEQILLINDLKQGNKFIPFIKKKPTLMLYYADWCPHCVDFKRDTWGPFLTQHIKTLPIQACQCEHSKFEFMPEEYRGVDAFPYIVMYYPTNTSKGIAVEEFNNHPRNIDGLLHFIDGILKKTGSKKTQKAKKDVATGSGSNGGATKRVVKKTAKTAKTSKTTKQ
jgi:hypothetical protein